MRHGWRRFRVIALATVMVLDACVVPIVLYYAMTYGGNVQEWISAFTLYPTDVGS